MQVIKRNGTVVPYDYNRIFNAIKAARNDVRPDIDDEQIRYVAIAVDNELAKFEKISVEEIQDLVEFKLMDFKFNDIAKSYIEYRQKHSIRRKAGMHLMDVYKDIFFTDSKDTDLKRENANIDANTSMACMLKLGTEGAKYFVDNYVLSKEFVDAEKEGYVHYHDKDFSLITFNCCQIDLLKVFKGGFNTGHGFIREPNSIRSYAALACIVIQANQNEMFGGQSINAFDFAMAEGVKKSFKKALANEIQKSLLYASDTRLYPADVQAELEKYPYGYGNPETVNSIMQIVNNASLSSKIYVQACMDVEEETKQAMEALIHNFNSLHSRAGSQTPFSSINYGLDTSPEGRLVIREVLNAIDAGLGNGETPIFPISVFQLKSGINYNVGDLNHDLFRLACKVSAKRLYPNFLSIDAPFNLQYYREGDYNSAVATMGCSDGDEIIVYKYRDKFYCEGIKKLWNRITAEIFTQGISQYKIPDDLKVWDGENGFVKVKTVIKNPDRGNWVRVKFSHERTILVTDDHPLYTENRGRVYVKDLKIGDTIKTYYDLPNMHSDEAISDINLAYILGLLITDGNYSGRVAVWLDTDTELKPIKEYLHKIFGGDMKSERSIPKEIFTASREIRLSFLRGMIDGDGHISYKSKVQLGSANKELALQQMALAQSLGYPAKVYLNYYNAKDLEKIRYRVEFSMNSEIEQYLACGKKLYRQWNGLESETKTTEIIAVTSIEYLGNLDKASYDLETVTDKFVLSFINSGNCRTRVMSNVNGPEQSGSRGNFAFATINLPLLALESKGSVNEFFRLFEKYIQICHDYLLSRLKIIEQKKVLNFPFLMGQGIWLDSEKLKPTDTIKDVLKHASYSIGFCGLAECLVALTGKHHGESEDAQKLGLEIIGYLRKRTDEYTEEEQRNWTTFATPAESTAGKFQRINRKKFGIIDGITDRDYMTNSSHVPVYYRIKASDKIRIEAPYHALCNAGHIAYIEMDGDLTKNPQAFEKIVRAMHDADMGYFSINHPVDRDPVCGYTGIIGNVCPKCGRRENDEVKFERIKRITGYLVGTLERWNDSKLAEARDRVKHDII